MCGAICANLHHKAPLRVTFHMADSTLPIRSIPPPRRRGPPWGARRRRPASPRNSLSTRRFPVIIRHGRGRRRSVFRRRGAGAARCGGLRVGVALARGRKAALRDRRRLQGAHGPRPAARRGGGHRTGAGAAEDIARRGGSPAWWAADVALAERLGWERPVALAATTFLHPELRGASNRRPRPSDPAWPEAPPAPGGASLLQPASRCIALGH